MTDTNYTKELERQNEILHKNLENHNLILDIIKSKVNIIECGLFKTIHPKQICSYIESLGWVQKYEKTHERYLTRCYISPHKDTKLKVFMQDLFDADTVTSNRGDGMASKLKEVVSLLARLHKKGELEVIFEILSERKTNV